MANLVEIWQAYPVSDYKVYLYFSDGLVRLYDAKPLITKGVFQKIADPHFFRDRCCVMNGTLAWDLSGRFDPRDCLDLDPQVLLQESVVVDDPLEETG